MTQTYSTQTIAKELQTLQLPFPDFLARALTALLTARKATLQQIANLLPGSTDTEAKRQELRRFLDQPALGNGAWARAIDKLLPKGAWTLAMDRTEWKLGKASINLLVLSVVFAGCAVPLIWIVMPEPGASDTRERIDLIGRFLSLFGRGRIAFLTADREFIGQEWIGWLLKSKVPFRIRIKAGEFLTHPDGRRRQGKQWFHFGSCRCKKRPWHLWGLPVFVGGKRLTRGDFLIVISNQRGEPLEDYRLRWKIETLFQAFKGRGFDMECSRLVDRVRLCAFLGFLSLALGWCLRVGLFLCRIDPLPPRKNGHPGQSVFRRGLDRLQQLLAALSGRPCTCCFVQAVSALRATL